MTVNRAQAELTRTVRHADVVGASEYDGLKSMQSWLRTHARFSAAAASGVVRSGRGLEHTPHLEAVFSEGHVTAAQVNVVADALGPTDVARALDQDVDLDAFDRAWTEVAATLPHAKLATAVSAFANAPGPRRARARPDRAAPAHDQQARRRVDHRPLRPRRDRRGEGPGSSGVGGAGLRAQR